MNIQTALSRRNGFSSARRWTGFLLGAFGGFAEAPALPEETDESAARIEADKSSYHLFNPTPKNLMREMSTDRPDKTESPYTVDAGHFQAEFDAITYPRDREHGTLTEGFAFFPANLKAGLTSRMDFHLVLETLLVQRVRGGGRGENGTTTGFGDVTARMKYNIWGNDGGRTAFAVMPFVKIPTNQHDLGNNAFEGGLILPLAVDLGLGWSMGLMAEVDLNRDGSGSGYHPEYIQSITFGHDIIGDLAGYVEFYSNISGEKGSDWIGSLDLGLTYAVTPDFQLDAGVNFGVSDAADDVQPFLGFTIRF